MRQIWILFQQHVKSHKQNWILERKLVLSETAEFANAYLA